MSNLKHTPGPLFVRQPAKWPFDIEIVDAPGNLVSNERRYAYSTSHTSIEDVMTARGFRPEDVTSAIARNEPQLADAHLRAAGPELLAELALAHQIIQNGLNLMTLEQKVKWSKINERAGLITDGGTRAHEREAVINKAKAA
jgi:hypothetical protein